VTAIMFRTESVALKEYLFNDFIKLSQAALIVFGVKSISSHGTLTKSNSLFWLHCHLILQKSKKKVFCSSSQIPSEQLPT